MTTQHVYIGGGCFWCTEAVFQKLKGVVAATPGYAGGATPNPTYEQVCSGNSGHVEVIDLEYDPAIISYSDLLAVFFNVHDPTTLNQQGNDVGTQYRSVIFYTTDAERDEARAFIAELEAAHAYAAPVVTTVEKLPAFYPAENYHRNYYQNHADMPYCQVIIAPKLEKLQQRFARLLADAE